MMGIFKLPQYRMYWSSDLSVPLISNTLTVNCFDNIKHFFHCNDNTKMPGKENPEFDKLSKVRPVIDSLLQNCKKVHPEERHSIDEQIILAAIPPKKPHKWNIEVWACC